MDFKKQTCNLSLILLVLLLASCGKEESPTETQSASVNGYVHTGDSDNENGHAFVAVSYSTEIPTVLLNGISLNSNDDRTAFWSDNFPIWPGQAADLEVIFTMLNGLEESASSSITLPGEFEILSPPPGEPAQIPLGAGFEASWSPSDGVDAYSAQFWLRYFYVNSLGIDTSYQFTLDTLMINTALTIAPSRIFPETAEIVQLDSSSGQFWVEALAGPWEANYAGNVTGEASGIFNGMTWGGKLDLVVSTTN